MGRLAWSYRMRATINVAQQKFQRDHHRRWSILYEALLGGWESLIVLYCSSEWLRLLDFLMVRCALPKLTSSLIRGTLSSTGFLFWQLQIILGTYRSSFCGMVRRKKTILTVDQIWRTVLRVRLTGGGAYAYQITTAQDSKTRDSSKKDQLICYQGTYPMFLPPHGPHISHVLLLHVAAYINILWQGRSYSFVIHKARAKSRPSSDEFIRDTHFKSCLFLVFQGTPNKGQGCETSSYNLGCRFGNHRQHSRHAERARLLTMMRLKAERDLVASEGRLKGEPISIVSNRDAEDWGCLNWCYFM